MTARSVVHDTFAIERSFAAAPARVFAAWASADAKLAWMGGPDEKPDEYELDFRVGGREFNKGSLPDGGPTITLEARYMDIVPDERIIYAYELYLGDARMSVSVGTIELRPDGAGTRLTYTEQGAYLDGLDKPAQRRQGTAEMFAGIDAWLQSQPAEA